MRLIKSIVLGLGMAHAILMLFRLVIDWFSYLAQQAKDGELTILIPLTLLTITFTIRAYFDPKEKSDGEEVS